MILGCLHDLISKWEWVRMAITDLTAPFLREAAIGSLKIQYKYII